MNPNNDIRDVKILEENKYLRYKPKEEYINNIAKVYEINTHGKYTVIARSSFLQLHVHPTTNINPCYFYQTSSICDSERFLQSNLNHNQYKDRDRKRKKWKLLHGKIRKLLKTNKKLIEDEMSSTFIVHASTIQNHQKHSPVIIQQGHSYYSFFAFLFIISIIIFGFILWYIFIKSSQSPKSTIRPVSDDSDSDDKDDNNQNKIRRLNNYKTNLSSSQTNKSVDSLFFDDNNYSERKSSHDMSSSNIRNHHEEINYQDIQILIQNLQQSDLESINSSTIGQILSDLIHHAINMINSNPNPQLLTDLLTFLSYTPQFFHIIQTIIANKCGSCESLNPTNFLQCQYLIDILHSSEYILEYLHRYYSHDKKFLVKILTDLYQILSSMNNNSYKYQYICQSLFNILQELNKNSIE